MHPQGLEDPQVKFAIPFANIGPFAGAEKASSFAQAAEECGFESLWTVEHVVVPSGYESEYPYAKSGKMPGREDAPIPDPLIWLTYIAACTKTIRLATGILILPQRNPVVLAKEVATLDALSGGRVDLGIGVGWLEEEFDAIGVPFSERGARTDEHVHVMRSLWGNEQASFDGKFTNFKDCIQRPQPTNGSVPIHIGGHSDIAARRAGRLGDGFFPGKGKHEELAHMFDVARASAVEHGRNPDAIEFTAGSMGIFGPDPVGELHALEDLGVSRVMVPALLFFEDTEAALARFSEDIIAKA